MKPDLKPPYKWVILHDDFGVVVQISRRLCSGEFFFWLLLDLREVEENETFTGQKMWRIMVSLVAPEKISSKEWEGVYKTVGGKDWLEQPVEARIMAEVIHEAGGASAPVFNVYSNNARSATLAAEKQLKAAMSDLKATLDRPMNKIGTTGWEALKGDIMAGLTRTAVDPGQEESNRLIRKLSGIAEPGEKG